MSSGVNMLAIKVVPMFQVSCCPVHIPDMKIAPYNVFSWTNVRHTSTL